MPAYIPDKDLITFAGWPGGLDNASSESALRHDRLRAAQNIDLDAAGKPSRRAGYTKLAANHGCHSLWAGALAMYAVMAGNLVAIDEQANIQTIQGGLSLDPVTYAEINGTTFWSSPTVNGSFQTPDTPLPFGIDAPSPPRLTTGAAGGLSAGTYLVAATCIDSRGIESGAGVSAAVEVAANGAVYATIDQLPTDAQLLRLYISQPNGDVCYLATELPAATGEYRIGLWVRGKALETQFLYAMPPAKFLTVYNGRLWGAVGSSLWFSEPYRYGHVTPHNYLRFPAPITMVIAVGTAGQSTLFVAAGNVTYRLNGADPAKMERGIAHKRGAVPYSAIVIPGNIFNIPNLSTDVAFWTTSNGVQCLGTPAGEVLALTENRAITSVGAESASAMLVERDGEQKILTALRGGDVSGVLASDSAVAEVIKLSQP